MKHLRRNYPQVAKHRRPLRENEDVSVLLSRRHFVLVVRSPNRLQLVQNEVNLAARVPHGVCSLATTTAQTRVERHGGILEGVVIHRDQVLTRIELATVRTPERVLRFTQLHE